MNKAYEEITNKIIEQLKNGCVPWEQPWFGQSQAISYATGKAYSLLNSLMLGGIGGEYLTWNQIQQHQAHLRKGSKGHRVFFWNTFDKVELNNDGERITKKIPYLKTYTVFNVNDCEGLQPRWLKIPTGISTQTPIKQVEEKIQTYLNREKIELKHNNTNESYYSKKYDYINVPPINNFKSSEDYYSTLTHEVIHSTGHAKRLNRLNPNGAPVPFGSKEYRREELVAEMGAAFLLNKFNIETQHSLEQNAAYIKGWLDALSDDMSLIAIAAGRAEKAVQFVLAEE